MGIKKKLLVSFFAIIFILFISEVFSVVMNRIILSKHEVLSDNMIAEYELIEKSSNLVESFNQIIKSPTDTTGIDNFNLIYADIKQLLPKIDHIIVYGDSQVIFHRLENNINDMFFDIEIGINDLNSNNYLDASSRYEEAKRKNEFVRENVTNLLLKELEYAKKLHGAVEQVQIIIQIIVILLFLIATAGCIWYAVTFSKKFVSPLIKLTKLAKVIEGGNSATTDPALLKGVDEVSSLTNSFNSMVASLKSSISKLQEYNLEIKKSHSLLEIERNKLQQYLDVAGVIVLIFDSNNKVLVINKKGCEILEIEASEIIGQNWIEKYVAKKNQTQTKGLITFLLNNIALSDTLENIITTKNNSEKNVVWHFSVLRDDSNSKQRILATGVDVTELTKAKITINQLKELDNLKNEVLNIATHELKTPLISIVGLSEVMESKPKTIPNEYQDYISIIHKEGLKLTGLIKTMLAANRNEVSKLYVDKETFDLISLVSSLKTPLGMLAKRTNSKIKFDLRVKKLIIESDKNKISQVLYNFIDNAVKYGPENQIISVNVFLLDNNFVKLEVSGLGAGISEEMQKKLFIKFSQLEPSLSRSQEGMGLGLYICKQNIESLGGQIGVVSKINEGATFYFTLPLNS
jgi:PAS domain S-box-containing protein